ncbi:MAG: sensor histidine kinase [Thermoleophilia bacterium]|nr:sensor histidine kinase [Thermoleophilia bacterium]
MARTRELIRRHGDLFLAGGLTALSWLTLAVDGELATWQKLVNAAMFLVLGVALAVRRRYPLLLFALVLVGGAATPWIGEAGAGETIGLFVLIAVYTAAAHTDGRRTWIAAVMTFALGWVFMLGDPEGVNVSAVVFTGLLFGTPWAVGRAIRHRRLREVALLGEQEQRARAAVAEERTRIARELHDVVAHAISVIVVQARGGRRLLATEPDEALAAFDTIESTGQRALGEMRRLLGMLRADDEALALAPQPSLARLEELVADVERAGLPVELAVDGDPAALPPGIDLSAYRIVQEALTNALKHAGPARARVLVRYREDGVELEIADDGRGSGNGAGAGHGLVGIRERVAMLGGDVEAGRRSEGGYAVRVRLPYSSAR